MGGNLDPAIAKCRVAVRGIFERYRDADPVKPIVVAYSGGADSLALLAACAFEAAKATVPLQAVTIDHGLQADSETVAQAAAATAQELGVQATVLRVTVAQTGQGPEAAAREARYMALYKYCAEVGAAALLTAHTLNDQAEQTLLALSRGSGLSALSGIAAHRTVAFQTAPNETYEIALLRPFLGIERSVTEAACVAENLEYWVDPHNSSPAFLRSRIRTELLPEITRVLGVGAIQNLARTASLLQADAIALNEVAAQSFTELAEITPDTVILPVTRLQKLPEAIRNRVIRLAATHFGVYYTQLHTQAVAQLVVDWRGQKALNLPGTVVQRRGKRVFISRNGYDKDTV